MLFIVRLTQQCDVKLSYKHITLLCKTDNKQHCYFSTTGWMNHNLGQDEAFRNFANMPKKDYEISTGFTQGNVCHCVKVHKLQPKYDRNVAIILHKSGLCEFHKHMFQCGTFCDCNEHYNSKQPVFSLRL